MTWMSIGRPNYFGRRRDEKVAKLNKNYGEGNWRLVWECGTEEPKEFLEACKAYYEESYFTWLSPQPDLVDWICTFRECIDNSMSNIDSGLDYSIQEETATHIQDIAVRNVLVRLGRDFSEHPNARILEIRGAMSNGNVLGPGNVPFLAQPLIITPYLTPTWAKDGSVECFWQSNKILQIKE